MVSQTSMSCNLRGYSGCLLVCIHSRSLQDGDIINIDITIYLDGYHGDTSKTFLVGNVVRTFAYLALDIPAHSEIISQDESGRSLVHTTEQALGAGIAACTPSRPFRDIGKAIHNFIKSKHDADGGYTTSAAFTGHGIGTAFHTLPWIVHTRAYRLARPL